MSILAVGSIAFDSIATPSGRVENVLGGSCTFFSLAASYFTDVRIVAVVGEDFTAEHENVLKKRKIDTRGIEHAKGKTFRWGGQYLDNLNEAKTEFTDLNVFESFQPRIPAEYSDSKFLFLGNINPTLQTSVRRSMGDVRLTGGDTMNYWIKRFSSGPGRNPETGQRAFDQRHRGQNACRRTQPASRRPKSACHGTAGAGGQARRIWRDDFLSRRRIRQSADIHSVRPPCPSKRSKILPERETRSPADSWDTSPRRNS